MSEQLLYMLPAFLLVLTAIVFVHEMGHYLVARWNGVAIQTFSIGFGPELFGFNDKHGTRWRFSAIPLGGYVRFVGDMNPASLPDVDAIAAADPELAPRLFVNKNVWQRIAVVVAGPVANIIFTFLVLYALLIGYGRYSIPPTIGEVVAGGSAAEAGLLAGDTVVSIDGYKVRSFDDIQRLVGTVIDRPVTMVVDRNDVTQTIVVTPQSATVTDRFGNEHRVGRIGVTRSVAQTDVSLYRPDPIEAVGMTLEEMRFIVDRTVTFVGELITGRGDIKQLGGPVEVARTAGQVATLGIIALVNFAAYVSLSIGLFNLVPIPMLDGGHIAYYLAEAIRRRPLSQRVQQFGFMVGFGLIMLLLATVTLFVTIPTTIPGMFRGG